MICTGTVYRSINNIYTVKEDEKEETYLCRIKGKVLALSEKEHNPLVIGDNVEFLKTSNEEGLILSRKDRISSFSRLNLKTNFIQCICANIDLVVIVCSVLSPQIDFTFIDRALNCINNADVLICVNKIDLKYLEDIDKELTYYENLGYKVLKISVKTNKNISTLKKMLNNKRTALVGESGVGKSSLVNLLLNVNQKVGDINLKYNKGNHTTNHSVMFDYKDEKLSFQLIDTPGFREIYSPITDVNKLRDSYIEFNNSSCLYSTCCHRGEEGCTIPQLINKGLISLSRYSSYCKSYDFIEQYDKVLKRSYK